MKQMSSELVDREERKHSLISKYTTSPCWISIQLISSARAPSAAAPGEWCHSAQGEGRAGHSGTRNPHSCATGAESTHGQPKIPGIQLEMWGKLGAASEDEGPPDSHGVKPRDS